MERQLYHPTALVESKRIGPDTRVEAFAQIAAGAVVGARCLIGSGVLISRSSIVGDRVSVMAGARLPGDTTVDNDVYIGHNAVLGDDVRISDNNLSNRTTRVTVRAGTRIGANATILPGITLGANTLIEAGAVVTRDVPRNSIVAGNPAHITGYVNSTHAPTAPAPAVRADGSLRSLAAAGACLYRMPLVRDLRGSLTFGEINLHLPFDPKRYFVVFDVPSRELRGEHAHLELHEFVVCLQGSCAFALDDGSNRDEVILDEPTIGLHIPPRLWRVHYKYSSDAIMLSLCSDIYRAEDYVRDYDDFLHLITTDGRQTP